MSDILANQTTDPLPQPSLDERLSKIEAMLAQVLEAQKSLSRDLKDRYIDLRERIEINNDKLSVVQRELNQIAKDIRNPAFS